MNKYSSYILYLMITFLVVILSINNIGPLENMQRKIDDFLCRVTAASETRSNIVVISIDGKAQNEYGNWPWNYDLIADLLAATATGSPKAIALNFIPSENTRQDSAGYTDIFAGQLTWINNIVMPYDIALATFRSSRTNNPKHLFDFSIAVDNPLGILNENSTLQVRKIFLPAEKILDSDPKLGFDFIMPDNDRVVRHQSLVMNYEGYYYPSLSLLSAATYLNIPSDQIKVIESKEIQLGQKRTIPINDKSEMFINFPEDNTFKKYSAADVLGEGFNFKNFNNKLVFIDIDDISTNQFFKTNINQQTSHSTIKLSIIDNIINNNLLDVKDDQAALMLLILFIIGGVCAFVMPQVTLLYRFVILMISFVILANVNYYLFSSFKVIVETIYIGFELVLFMIASPFLDSKLLTSETKSAKKKTKVKIPKIKTEKKELLQSAAIPVREIKASANDRENQPTTAVATANDPLPKDHQAIDLKDEKGETIGTANIVPPSDKSDSGTSAFEPEIITPDDYKSDGINDYSDSEQIADSSTPIYIDQTEKLTHLGRYQVTGTLGKGAMGLVYKGIDPAINRPVALKTIRLDFVNDPEEMEELKERLFREAQAAGKLSHPNIVTIYDVGSHEHLQYIAMEYLEGHTLEEMIKKKTKFNFKILSKIIIQICYALEYAHEKGIVHRDIKPANIMVLKDYSVKVMDYGIARVDSASMTKTGVAMGTPNYISPEQLEGRTVDKRADIFSLGVVIYELLLGERPFKGDNITALIYSILNHEPEKPSNINSQIPLLFDHIVNKALKKDPYDRYQKASELITDLLDFVESFVT